MILAVSMLAGGMAVLVVGAGRFVEGAVRLSRALGVSSVMIGALVVGLGTSAPELLVSGLAAARGELDIAVGNVVGSNVANVTLVLGLATVGGSIATRLIIIRREGVLMVVSVGILAIFVWNLYLSRAESIVLLAGMVVAIVLLQRWSKVDAPQSDPADRQAGWGIGWTLAGLVATVGGAEILLRGASRLVEELGVSTAFVGMVIVAVGTSLPEVATAIAAARKGEGDLLVGNVLGSNIFNSLVVAGTAGMVGPGEVAATFRAGSLFMVAAAVLAGIFHVTGLELKRSEGLVLLVVFAGFAVMAA